VIHLEKKMAKLNPDKFELIIQGDDETSSESNKRGMERHSEANKVIIISFIEPKKQ
jgi:hypothetical protein